jgi:REP element-mobilizing transposase RayT
MCGVCRTLDSPVIKIKGVADHIDVLLQIGKTIVISKLISEVKSSSSRWIKTKGTEYRNFAWQSVYGGFSVSRPSLEHRFTHIFLLTCRQKWTFISSLSSLCLLVSMSTKEMRKAMV